ncbi:tetratricopeptide repeat protein [Spartinivicinus ruber]|uniref:glycosyltransferase family 4 protein n=1 Tax=Spartinivicinus ruber TaxID=2683272 RepID=UPI0013D28CE9|nr:glycosyltransferase family 4 protein [Spartinivicinus ruber]
MDHIIQHAEQLVRQQQYNDALATIQPVLLQQPNNDKALNIAAVIAALQGNTLEAIEYFAKAMQANPTNTDAIYNLCALVGKKRSLADQYLKLLANSLSQWIYPELKPETGNLIKLTFDKLSFNKAEPMEWLTAVFDNYALPILLTATQHDHYDLAFFLEGYIYQHYVKREESEAHFEQAFKHWKNQMHAAGQRYRKTVDEIIANENWSAGKPLTENNLPKIAFILHTSSTLAHVEALISFFAGHQQLATPLISPIVISIANNNADMVSQFRALKVPIMEIEAEHPQMPRSARYAFLKSYLFTQGYQTLVWITSVPEMSFAFGLRLAKTQIWWTMKFHGFSLPDIDGYVSSMHVEETFELNGIQWHGGTLSSANWFDETQTAPAKQLRNQYPYDCLYGTIAREEKLNDPLFLNCIAEILIANPNAGYLFTGRELDPMIKQVFEEQGVASRCHFVGWINSKLYCQVIDIFLDSFPCGSGYSLLESMAAAKPVVLFNNPTYISYYPTIAALIKNYLPSHITTEAFYASVATNITEYQDIALRLATQQEKYLQASQLNVQLINELFANQQRCADIYCRHFLTISQQA